MDADPGILSRIEAVFHSVGDALAEVFPLRVKKL